MTQNKQFYSSFRSTDNKGFHMTFDNLLTISVQWGTMNQCSNSGSILYDCGHRAFDYVTAITAEIAIWDTVTGGQFTFSNGDTVLGYITPNQVAEWITLVSNAKGLSNLPSTIEPLADLYY